MKPAAGGRIAGTVPAMVGNGDAAVMPVAGWSGRRRSRRRHALAPVAKILEYKVCAPCGSSGSTHRRGSSMVQAIRDQWVIVVAVVVLVGLVVWLWMTRSKASS